jgi:hypothetical protein
MATAVAIEEAFVVIYQPTFCHAVVMEGGVRASAETEAALCPSALRRKLQSRRKFLAMRPWPA